MPPVAAPLAVELYRAALAAGAHPYANVELERLAEILRRRKGATSSSSSSRRSRARRSRGVDAIVTVWSEANTRALTRVRPGARTSG